jgi:hypothetical protein
MTNQRAVLSGQVLDAQGQPVSGARVFVRGAPGPVFAAVQDIALLTSGDGRFTLSLPGPGRYELACSDDALGTTSAVVAVVASADSSAALILRYAKGSQP